MSFAAHIWAILIALCALCFWRALLPCISQCWVQTHCGTTPFMLKPWMPQYPWQLYCLTTPWTIGLPPLLLWLYIDVFLWCQMSLCSCYDEARMSYKTCIWLLSLPSIENKTPGSQMWCDWTDFTRISPAGWGIRDIYSSLKISFVIELLLHSQLATTLITG